ncbi:hypothetical protein VNO80_26812 [Phaseolus coccineus]|uniref:Uncharacterized protein n=1 Tax=Phaseolus coccineus TaxID=3886 RepID=A0AAN9QH15_PHACN
MVTPCTAAFILVYSTRSLKYKKETIVSHCVVELVKEKGIKTAFLSCKYHCSKLKIMHKITKNWLPLSLPPSPNDVVSPTTSFPPLSKLTRTPSGARIARTFNFVLTSSATRDLFIHVPRPGVHPTRRRCSACAWSKARHLERSRGHIRRKFATQDVNVFDAIDMLEKAGEERRAKSESKYVFSLCICKAIYMLSCFAYKLHHLKLKLVYVTKVYPSLELLFLQSKSASIVETLPTVQDKQQGYEMLDHVCWLRHS